MKTPRLDEVFVIRESPQDISKVTKYLVKSIGPSVNSYESEMNDLFKRELPRLENGQVDLSGLMALDWAIDQLLVNEDLVDDLDPWENDPPPPISRSAAESLVKDLSRQILSRHEKGESGGDAEDLITREAPHYWDEIKERT